MKTDNYTKGVLTLIAFFLMIIAMKGVDLLPTANASNKTDNIPAFKNYGLIPVNDDGSINVKFNQNQVVDVRLRGIDEASNLRWEAIKVKVQE